MSTWGQLTWGSNSWSSDQNNTSLSGISLSASLEGVTTEISVEVVVTGIEITSSLTSLVAGTSALVTPNSPSPLATLSLNNVFGGELVTVQVTSASNEAWGENAWSDGGWGVGDGQTISIGDTSVAIGQQIDAQGQELTVTLTDVLAGISVIASPTGIELTPDLGSLSFESKYLIGSAQADTAVGTALGLANANVDITGSEIAGNTGQLEYEAKYLIGSAEATSIVGNAFGGELVTVQVSTASAQPWGETAWGEGQWGQSVGTDIGIGGEEVAVPSVEVAVTNTNLTLNVLANNQPFIIADANVAVTGQQITTTLGDEDAIPNTIVDLSGVSITLTMDNVLAGISVLVLPTGVTSAISTGTIGLNAWEIVDSGTAPTWTEVDKAA